VDSRAGFSGVIFQIGNGASSGEERKECLMGKKIGITYDLKTDWEVNPEDPKDISAEFDKPETVESVVTALESGGHTVKRIGNVENLLAQIDGLDVDIVFNICEGIAGRNRESQVPMILEMKGIPYVGADALTLGLTLDKVVAKKVFIAEGIPTPTYFVATEEDDLELLNTIGYPLIVKTRHEGSSKGIDLKSRVETLEELKDQVAFINCKYHQPALVEEFISGTEFTIPVIGNYPPEAMPIVQVSIGGSTELGARYYTNDHIYSSDLQYVCPARISEPMTKKMQDLAVRVFRAVDCRDWGRVDFRADSKGNLYVLEINPLPTLDSTDAFNLFPQVIGSTYDAIVNRIVDFALERYERQTVGVVRV